MPGGTESLNAAAAAAICFFERVRQGGQQWIAVPDIRSCFRPPMIQPVLQSLRIKPDIQAQQVTNFFLRQFAAVHDDPAQQQLSEFLHQRVMPVRAAHAVSWLSHMRVDQFVHFPCVAGQVANTAIVGEKSVGGL